MPSGALSWTFWGPQGGTNFTGGTRPPGPPWNRPCLGSQQPVTEHQLTRRLAANTLRLLSTVVGDSPLSQSRYYHVMYRINFCILALGSGQRLVYRLGSGLGLVLVLVLRFCMCPADFCDTVAALCDSLPSQFILITYADYVGRRG